MSKPQIHTFGVAKYVYAAAYDQIEAERDALKATLNHVWPMVTRYLDYKGHAPEANTLHDIAVIIKAGDDA